VAEASIGLSRTRRLLGNFGPRDFLWFSSDEGIMRDGSKNDKPVRMDTTRYSTVCFAV